MSTSVGRSILRELKALSNPENLAGMARFGINPKNTLGVSMPVLRKLARAHRQNHGFALELWESGIHEARILASLIDDPRLVTKSQMEKWLRGFDSWDVCDQVCGNLFDKTPYAYEKAAAWSARTGEFQKRAGFALMAYLAVHDKESGDRAFETFLPLIVREAGDERNFVRKSVNWALRQIGKRNARLRARAMRVARVLSKSESRSARWVGVDALRELGRIRK